MTRVGNEVMTVMVSAAKRATSEGQSTMRLRCAPEACLQWSMVCGEREIGSWSVGCWRGVRGPTGDARHAWIVVFVPYNIVK